MKKPTPLFFWFISLLPFINKLKSSRDLTISLISSISSFEIIIDAVLERRAFFKKVAASTADAAVVNPNGIKTLLVSCVSTFLADGKPVFNNGPRSLARNPPDSMILGIYVFDNLTSADKLFAKIYKYLKLVNQLASPSARTSFLLNVIPMKFDDSIQVTPVAFSVAGFNFSSFDLENFIFKVLHWVILYCYYIRLKQIHEIPHKTLTVLCKNPKEFILLLQEWNISSNSLILVGPLLQYFLDFK